jgi:hypothetical protein
MAVDADLYMRGGQVDLQLYMGQPKDRVSDDPPELPNFDPGSTTWLYYDGDHLERDEYEFLSIEVSDIGRYGDDDIAVVERLDAPRVNVREHGLVDVSVADVLRWARARHREAVARGEGEVWGSPRSMPEAAPRR